jgi:hypothetical protein
MSEKKGIYWLASYPKSGNTWFRIVLYNILNKKEELDNLDEIRTGAIASGRQWVDNMLGFESALLTHNELDAILPDVYTHYHEIAQDLSYHKIHNAYTYLDKEKTKPLLPPSCCHGAVYIMRNPLDVAISLANHNSCPIQQSIDGMANYNLAYGASPFEQGSQIRHKLGSWSHHVESWQEAPANVLTIRYEDMKMNPLDTFSKAMDFLQIEVSEENVAKAIDNASMEKLKHLEETKGFKERPAKVQSFFRKGVMDDWKENLTSDQIKQIVRQHAGVMDKFGYLDEELIEYF